MQFIALLPLVLSLSFGLIPTFHYFDKLVEHIYSNHREEWKQMGSPVGILWRPIDLESTFESSQSTLHISLLWVFKSPVVIVADIIARHLFDKFKRHFYIWIIGFILTVATAIYSLQFFPSR